MKKILSIVLALVLVLGLSTTAFADASNTSLSMTATVSGTTYNFTVESKEVENIDGTDHTAYAVYATLPSGTNLSSLPVTINYSGTSILINGTAYDPTHTGTVSITLDIPGTVVEIKVGYGTNKYEYYYVSAYTSSAGFNATFKFDYTNAYYFAATSGSTYTGHFTGCTHCPYLSSVTSMQKTTAYNDLLTVYAKLNFLSGTAPFVCDHLDTPMDLMDVFANAYSLGVTKTTQNYITFIEDLGPTSTGRYVDAGSGFLGFAGGWMYSVTRGSTTLFPQLAADTFKLMPGDIVTWIYTCDLGYDVLGPMM